MIEIEELHDQEIATLLSRIGYGHLACSRNDQPYVVPIHFSFSDEGLFIYTTEGKKSEYIAANPRVCLQAEEVTDNLHWQSVIVYGTAIRLADGAERDMAFKNVLEINPTLTPAVSIRWMDEWVRENIEAIYQIVPERMTGRRSVQRSRGLHKTGDPD